MNKLPEKFEFHKYGLDVRFVNESDAEFILTLRTSKRGQILNKTENSLDKQVQWISEYKQREAKGEDYYFIYYKGGEPLGVNRLYNVRREDNSCTTGSWVIKEGTTFETSMKTMLILREIVFEILQLDISWGDTRKSNKQMQRLYNMLGIEQIGETEDEFLYKSIRENYEYGNNKIKKLIGIE